MHAIGALVHWLVVRDDGQDLVEYGLLVVLIAIIAIAGVTAVGRTVNTVFWQTFAHAI